VDDFPRRVLLLLGEPKQSEIWIRRSRTIAGIGQDLGVCVWSAPQRGANSDNVWAPELHLIDGKWFIYFAADDGDNDNHRMWALEIGRERSLREVPAAEGRWKQAGGRLTGR